MDRAPTEFTHLSQEPRQERYLILPSQGRALVVFADGNPLVTLFEEGGRYFSKTPNGSVEALNPMRYWEHEGTILANQAGTWVLTASPETSLNVLDGIVFVNDRQEAKALVQKLGEETLLTEQNRRDIGAVLMGVVGVGTVFALKEFSPSLVRLAQDALWMCSTFGEAAVRGWVFGG